MCVVTSKSFMVQAGSRPLYICGTLERDSEFLAKKAFLFIVYCRVRPRQFLVVHFIYTHTHEEAQTHTRISVHNFFHYNYSNPEGVVGLQKNQETRICWFGFTVKLANISLC